MPVLIKPFTIYVIIFIGTKCLLTYKLIFVVVSLVKWKMLSLLKTQVIHLRSKVLNHFNIGQLTQLLIYIGMTTQKTIYLKPLKIINIQLSPLVCFQNGLKPLLFKIVQVQQLHHGFGQILFVVTVYLNVFVLIMVMNLKKTFCNLLSIIIFKLTMPPLIILDQMVQLNV